jgi:hypothetical protein
MAIKDLKPGDALLWWSDKMEIQLGSKLWSIPIPMPCAVHADIYIGDGKCRTSIQNMGSSTADVEKRKKQFPQHWAAVRLIGPDALSNSEMNDVVRVAKSIKCEYDWMGYYGQYADIFLSPKTFPIPDFSSESDVWTAKMAAKTIDPMYCSAFVTYCLWMGANRNLAGKSHYITSPQDIYDYAKKNKTRRMIIENF